MRAHINGIIFTAFTNITSDLAFFFSLVSPDLVSELPYFLLVSAQSLKSNLDSMGHQIQRLENDIKKFPKTEDPYDKFVEKMIISFASYCLFASQICELCPCL